MIFNDIKFISASCDHKFLSAATKTSDCPLTAVFCFTAAERAAPRTTTTRCDRRFASRSGFDSSTSFIPPFTMTNCGI